MNAAAFSLELTVSVMLKFNVVTVDVMIVENRVEINLLIKKYKMKFSIQISIPRATLSVRPVPLHLVGEPSLRDTVYWFVKLLQTVDILSHKFLYPHKLVF